MCRCWCSCRPFQKSVHAPYLNRLRKSSKNIAHSIRKNEMNRTHLHQVLYNYIYRYRWDWNFRQVMCVCIVWKMDGIGARAQLVDRPEIYCRKKSEIICKKNASHALAPTFPYTFRRIYENYRIIFADCKSDAFDMQSCRPHPRCFRMQLRVI